MFLLDTNVISELMKTPADKNVVAWADDQSVSSLYISAVTHAEIHLGIELKPEGKRKTELRERAERILARLDKRILSFDKYDAIRFATIVAERRRLGRPIHHNDAQIAATAVEERLTLVTRNTKDFEHIEGLNLLNPWFE